MGADTFSREHALAARIDLCANGGQRERVVPNREADILRSAIEQWVDEVGMGQVPDSIVKLRYRLRRA